MKKRIITGVIAVLCYAGLNAQLTDIGTFLANGPQDAQKLMEAYLSPYFNAFGASMTGGWYNTAKPHKLGGFDLTATFNTAIVPQEHRTFDVSEIGLQSLELNDPTTNIAPTVAGEKSAGPRLDYALNLPGIENPEAFNLPQGTGFKYVPTPMLQGNIGFIKSTEISARYMPTYNFKDASFGMWGIGFKHGLKQYIPFIKRVPVLHLSVQYGYTKLNSSIGMDVRPEHIGATTDQLINETFWDDQKMEFVTQSHTANLIFSANLPVVCFYGGVGFATTKSNVALKGNFPIIDPTEPFIGGSPVVTEAYVSEYGADPIDMEIKNSDGSTTKPRLNAGMRLKFAVVTIHADYTYANYSMFTLGFGIGFFR